jgi:hypothetical protein
VTGHDADRGAPAQGRVLHGTSAVPAVTATLNPAELTNAKTGNKVRVTLPDGGSRNGRVVRVSPVATTSDAQDGQPESTVPITIRLSGRPVRALDQALVQVELTTVVARDVLAVPIVALLARPGGRFAVVADGRQVPVECGLFDESAGLVEVTGVNEGASVEVPAG